MALEPEPVTWDAVKSARDGVAVLIVEADREPAAASHIERLADLARGQDLVVVCGLGAAQHGFVDSYALVTGLREALPRRSVIALVLAEDPDALQQELAIIANLIDDGAVAVALTLAADPVPVAARVARHLETRTLLRVAGDACHKIPLDPAQ